MANHYDIVVRPNAVYLAQPGVRAIEPRYMHEGEEYRMWAFERWGDDAADVRVAKLNAQGFEAIKVHVGQTRRRDIDD